jgi:DNA-binding beta-propeller fold protein YncE
MSMEGAMCEFPPPAPRATADEAIPINPVTIAMALQQGTAAPRAAVPTAARKAAVAARKPVRTIRDRYPQFSAVAVDSERNEVVLQDENLFQTMVFDRSTNTPPRAAMSEPKRSIRGPNTYLELNCAVYIDPKTGNIYSLNNDTERHMTVWDRQARGDASPAWKLRTPMGSFGLAVDEEAEELLITAQHEQVVAAYAKTASDDDPPKWVLWGDKTLIADPHGIAIDAKLNVFFVANFGSTSSPRAARPGENPLLVAVGRGNMIPGSGRFMPPSITVYDKKARGDTAPIRVITGSNTQLNWPAGLFVDSERGELYVANDGGNSILVFSTEANGNAAPVRILKGPRTKLSYPSNIFVDLRNDELWVANFGNHRATVYQRAAAGDTAPIREIRSAPDGTPAPTLANTRIAYDTTRDQILAPN